MPQFHIKSQRIKGFAADSVVANGTAKVFIKMPFISSDAPFFFVLVTQISKVFFSKIPFSIDYISNFLIVLHNDNSADIYVNDYDEIFKAKLNRSTAENQPVYHKDIDDITELRFPRIEIKNDDAILYCKKVGWKFGLFFDFKREINVDELSKELGSLLKELHFKRDVSVVETELKEIMDAKSKEALVITEGKTDWKHLKKAQEQLRIELPIKFNEDERDQGDSDTLKMCDHFSRTFHQSKVIFIFDQDNPIILQELRKRTKEGNNYQDWGNNVYSFYIPKPAHRQQHNNISIEFYYTDDEIHTIDTETGKQLLFTNEIEEHFIKSSTYGQRTESKIVKLDKPKMDEEADKKICSESVDSIVDITGALILHSKTVFANNIFNSKVPFNSFNFDRFKVIFTIIEEILKLPNK